MSGRIVQSGDPQGETELSCSPPRSSGIQDPSFNFPAGAQGFKKPDYVIVAPHPARPARQPRRPREEICNIFNPMYREGDLLIMYRQAERARARARREAELTELRDCQRPSRRIDEGYMADVSDDCDADIDDQGWGYYTNPNERPFNPLQ